MQQHFELGKWLRLRYGRELLNDRYTKENIYVQSTDVDRTLMSALCNLAGLFTPIPEQQFNADLMWQPIPVHTTPEGMDKVLASKKACPAFDYALKRYKKSDAEYRELNKRFQPLYAYLTEHSGKKVDSFTSVQNLYNNLFIENLKNMTWA